MASRKGGSRRGGGLAQAASIAGGIIVFLILVGILIESGAWAKFAPSFGLKPISSLAELMPGEDSMRKNDLRLNLEKPSLPSVPNNGNANGDNKSTDAGENAEPEAVNPSQSLPAASSSPLSVADALAYAETIKTAKPHTTGYKANREALFGGWANSDRLCGNGTTRDLILKRDLSNVTMSQQCTVLSGEFTDPYTGRPMTFKRGKDTSGLIQIDHVVALYDAYASGLWNRSQEERARYANDPDVLLASEGKANMVKSEGVNLDRSGGRKGWDSSTPSVWLPSNTAYQCEYMAKRVSIKKKYGLSMSVWERNETVGFLRQCLAS